jgi:hypothetical protein
VNGQLHVPAALSLGKESLYTLHKELLGPKAELDALEKSYMMPESRNSSLLGNGSVNIFPRKRTLATLEERVFCGQRRARCYATVLLIHFCSSELTRNNRGSGVSCGGRPEAI